MDSNLIEKLLQTSAIEDKDAQKLLVEEQIRDQRANRGQRKIYAQKIFDFVSYYMAGVFILLLLTGSPNKFVLSDTVICTILGTTSINVIGVLVIVITYYFHTKK